MGLVSALNGNNPASSRYMICSGFAPQMVYFIPFPLPGFSIAIFFQSHKILEYKRGIV